MTQQADRIYDELLLTLARSGVALAGFNGTGLLKMWVFMRMNHLEQLREIKRLELQVARLNGN